MLFFLFTLKKYFNQSKNNYEFNIKFKIINVKVKFN